MTLNLRAGHQPVANYGNYSDWDYKIGLPKEIVGHNLVGTIVGTSAKDTWWHALMLTQA